MLGHCLLEGHLVVVGHPEKLYTFIHLLVSSTKSVMMSSLNKWRKYTTGGEFCWITAFRPVASEKVKEGGGMSSSFSAGSQ